MMNGEISIRPSKDIRTNYAEVSALAHQHPVAITVNGREDTVLLSHADFLEQQRTIIELQERLAIYAETGPVARRYKTRPSPVFAYSCKRYL